MGYRSKGVLAVDKKAYTASKVLIGNLPKLLDEMEKDENVSSYGTTVYFTFDGFKMYSNYPDVAEFYSWLDSLEKLEEESEYDSTYAYLELGEEGEVSVERGDTSEYDLYVVSTIEYPLGEI